MLAFNLFILRFLEFGFVCFLLEGKMRPKYTPLNKLTDKSKWQRIKARLSQKGPPMQSPSKTRFQKLTLKDDQVRSLLFNFSYFGLKILQRCFGLYFFCLLEIYMCFDTHE